MQKLEHAVALCFHILIRSRKASDPAWIAADDYYVKLHVSGKSYLLRISMNDLEEKLDPNRFLRIHRSSIINFDRVKELHQNPNGEYIVVLKNGTELKLSRTPT